MEDRADLLPHPHSVEQVLRRAETRSARHERVCAAGDSPLSARTFCDVVDRQATRREGKAHRVLQLRAGERCIVRSGFHRLYAHKQADMEEPAQTTAQAVSASSDKGLYKSPKT